MALWRQIAEQLRGDIMAGGYDAGAKLPAEKELAARFGVNRHTLRRALASLAEDGLVRADRGLGTFVQQARVDYPITARTRFSEIIASQQRAPGGRLISSAEEKADAHIAALLACPIGAAVLRLDTLHVADGMPLSVTTSWFPVARFPRLVTAYAETGSLTKAMAAHGVSDYLRKETRLIADAASPRDADLLHLPAGAPLLVSESVNVDPHGVPILVSRARFAGDRVQIVVGPQG